jgi:hypothetical protein
MDVMDIPAAVKGILKQNRAPANSDPSLFDAHYSKASIILNSCLASESIEKMVQLALDAKLCKSYAARCTTRFG